MNYCVECIGGPIDGLIIIHFNSKPTDIIAVPIIYNKDKVIVSAITVINSKLKKTIYHNHKLKKIVNNCSYYIYLHETLC